VEPRASLNLTGPSSAATRCRSAVQKHLHWTRARKDEGDGNVWIRRLDFHQRDSETETLEVKMNHRDGQANRDQPAALTQAQCFLMATAKARLHSALGGNARALRYGHESKDNFEATVDSHRRPHCIGEPGTPHQVWHSAFMASTTRKPGYSRVAATTNCCRTKTSPGLLGRRGGGRQMFHDHQGQLAPLSCRHELV
jgi:hypothetical protein